MLLPKRDSLKRKDFWCYDIGGWSEEIMIYQESDRRHPEVDRGKQDGFERIQQRHVCAINMLTASLLLLKYRLRYLI